jgi:hypothetical protein
LQRAFAVIKKQLLMEKMPFSEFTYRRNTMATSFTKTYSVVVKFTSDDGKSITENDHPASRRGDQAASPDFRRPEAISSSEVG